MEYFFKFYRSCMHVVSLTNVTPTLAFSRNIFNDIVEILQNEGEQ
jgi:hypothetical protein